MFPYEKAMKLLDLYPDALWSAQINGKMYLLRGAVMKGFILSDDEIERFEKFSDRMRP